MKRTVLALIFVASLVAFATPVSAQILDNQAKDLVYDDYDAEDIRPVPYDPLRKADVMWSKRVWREIDMRQKMNQVFYYPIEPHNNWRNFMTF